MAIKSRIAATALMSALVATGGCMSDRARVDEPAADVPTIGIGSAVSGYLIGDIVGGRQARASRAAGAGIGGIAGAGIGVYMDTLESDLRSRTAGSDMQVIRQGDDLILIIPSGASFGYRSAAIEPPLRLVLDQIGGSLADHAMSYVDVYGHTDAIGGLAYNQRLSDRRARAVGEYLASRGVQTARIGTRGYGASQPVAPNDSLSGRAGNRRVEIKIVPIPDTDLRR